MADGDTARFGEQPLAQTVAAAGALRRLAGQLLSLEHPHPAVDAVIERVGEWESELAGAVAQDATPRIGDDGADTQRVYLAHAFDIGAFNPCFPEYEFDRIDAETAAGRVTFPVVYEGPPGLVHGGFLAVFFDCVIQHQNCATELSGKTRSLNVKFRRPTPILTEAATGRRGAVHRRGQHARPLTGQTHRVQLRQATGLTSWSCRAFGSRASRRSWHRGCATRSCPDA
jgi:acyl-coenzyme A thioesterase PaaI-like protein